MSQVYEICGRILAAESKVCRIEKQTKKIALLLKLSSDSIVEALGKFFISAAMIVPKKLSFKCELDCICVQSNVLISIAEIVLGGVFLSLNCLT